VKQISDRHSGAAQRAYSPYQAVARTARWRRHRTDHRGRLARGRRLHRLPALSYESTATVKVWTACRAGGRVALVRWDGLAHRWPGIGWVDPDATARLLMWRFLTSGPA